MLYLAPYIGSGTHFDPFRPDGVAGFADYGVIDLRPDSRVADGYGLVDIPGVSANIAGLLPIGESGAEAASVQTLTKVANRLSIPLAPSATVGDFLADLMFTPDKRWKPVYADSLGRKYVYLNGEVWAFRQVRVPAPGELIDPSDTFTRGDENPLAGNWSNLGGASLRLLSNQLAGPAASNDSGFYYNAFTPQNDQFAECTYASGALDWGPAIRMQAPGTFSFYWMTAYAGNPGCLKMVAGTASIVQLASSIPATPAGAVLRAEATGSSLNALTTGVNWGAFPHTDTTFSTGRTGIFVFESDVRVSLFSTGDLGVVPPDVPVLPWNPFLAPQQRMG